VDLHGATKITFERHTAEHMKAKILLITSITGFLALAVQLAFAQEDHFTFNVGGGFTGVGGAAAGKLDHGGNLLIGAGYNFNRFLSLNGNFMFHQLGITGAALNVAQEPDGNARVYTFAMEPKLRLPVFFGVHAYAMAGGGWLRRTVQFTQPTLAQTVIFDPWFGYFGPALVQVNQVLGSYTDDAGMYDVGAGAEFHLPFPHTKLFVEGRYIHGFTNGTQTILAPLTVGLRF
jgi:hypothetical protein